MRWLEQVRPSRQATRAGERSPGRPSVRRSVGIYLLLLSLPLFILLPLLLYSGSLLYLMAGQARRSADHELVAADRALGIVVERELERTLETLSLISSTPALDGTRPDLERLQSLIASVVKGDLGLDSVAVIDPQGQVLIEYPPRPGSPRQLPSNSTREASFSNGQPQVSALRPSPDHGRLVITIIQPVVRNGRVPWVISGELNPHHLAEIMRAQVGERDAVASVLDPLYQLLARSRDMDRFFGMRPSNEKIAFLSRYQGGTWRMKGFDGSEYLWAWTSTPFGWTVLLGVPAVGVDEALRQSMWRLIAGGVALLLLGAGATVLVARRIARSVDRMADNVPRLARGEIPPYQPSRIRQLDALYDALLRANDQAARALADRDRALVSERAAREIADEDNRTKDVFIATLSHELRNPLAPVRSATHILQSPKASESARLRAAEVIQRQVAAMARLLDDLLDLSRIRSGRIELERRRVSLRSVMEAAIEVARPVIDARGHAFSCMLPGQELLLEADPLRLSQAFANLLTNAAKYTDPGGRIAIWADPLPGQVVVHVQDTGIGLAPRELEQVFQMFSQVRGERERSQGGLGIGLWLVRALVELHGGWVRAESRGHGQGSEFIVGLPLADGDAGDSPAQA